MITNKKLNSLSLAAAALILYLILFSYTSSAATTICNVESTNYQPPEDSEEIVSEIGVSDNRLREASPDTVYKDSSFIDVGGMNNVRYRDILQFDLSKYTSNSRITNAVLSLYWYYPTGKTRPEDTVIEIYRPATSWKLFPWDQDYISWNKEDKDDAWRNAGGDWYDKNGILQGNTPYATITIKGSTLPDNRYYELDVTDLVEEYVIGKYENTGILIKARTESNNYIAFYSSDWTDENQRPKITVTEEKLPYEINIIQIFTLGSANDPNIYDDMIVYEDRDNGKTDIYAYELSGHLYMISKSGTANSPAIYGDKIVWMEDRNGKSDIYMYNISTSQETQISTNGTALGNGDSGPDIYKDTIVWEELNDTYRSNHDTYRSNLVIHNLSTQQNTQIPISNKNLYSFAIHDDKIVVCSGVTSVTYQPSIIDMYDLSTQETTRIISGGLHSSAIYDNRIAYLEKSDRYNIYVYDLYVYDLSTQQGIQVSTSGNACNPIIYSLPSIYNDRIVWGKFFQNGMSNIYMYDLSNSKETQITTSGNAMYPDIYGDTIVWIDHEDIYTDKNDIFVGTVSEGKYIISEIGVSDNRLREASPDTVYKDSSFIDVGGMNNVRYRDILQFDLSKYTSNSRITNAVLSLYWYYPAGKTRPEDTVIEIYRPASSWNLDYVSWNKKDKNVAWEKPGGDWYDKNGILQGNTPYATITVKGSFPPGDKYYELDVTDLVKEYTSGKYENTGFLIKARTENNNYIAFYSSDWTDENQKPKITVVEKEVPVVTVTGATDNRLREASPNTVYSDTSFIDIGGMNNVRYRDIIRFDLSEYKGDTSIEKAALYLYWYYPAGKTRPEDTVIEIYRPASSWNSDYVSWNKRDNGVVWTSPGGDWYDKNGVLQGGTPYATITIRGSSPPDNKYYKLDVTDLVKEYTSGKYENTGFLIKAHTESNNYIAFYSSDCGNESQVPKLQLVYS
ncbi:disaggregatase related repeat-containing protein [Methanosarcina mazei]|uniref:DNRLRE domain-containing protein n=1 Tax=Methanosarcina mazei TaxID=2209 RepID=A0A6C0VL69_METMZ|nr:disaggregatase related repeat-containing protein [Methanosarcina mazei]MDY0246586.1 disaggregatase related repeat-containing protein [Methanosarcina mazei]QIB92011.1 DNRLRE domain-containing protein [Methanosarcina mazei]UWJ21353.1 hypothetical protein MSMAT_0096 [Methanosarcina mazei TMA]BBL65322.1 hypothetical protein MmazTMA_22990 [Methanosarcina mazei]